MKSLCILFMITMKMKAVTIDHPDFGSAWRERDYNFVLSEELKALLKKSDIQLVSWKQVQKACTTKRVVLLSGLNRNNIPVHHIIILLYSRMSSLV
jgi:hypothetical protein